MLTRTDFHRFTQAPFIDDVLTRGRDALMLMNNYTDTMIVVRFVTNIFMDETESEIYFQLAECGLCQAGPSLEL